MAKLPLIFLIFYAAFGAAFAQAPALDPPTFKEGTFGFVCARNLERFHYKTYPTPEEVQAQKIDPTVPTFKPLKFSHSSLLGQNKYFGPPVFELYRHDSATRQYEKMAAFPFKKNGEKKNFIIFARNPKEMKKGAKPDLAFYEFSPETKKYPYESVTILNFTQHPISGSVNGVVCRGIGMSGQTVKASQFESGRKTIDIKLFRYDAENERVLPAYTAELINAKKTRFFVLLMPTAREFPFAADAALIIDAQPPTIAELKALADAEM